MIPATLSRIAGGVLLAFAGAACRTAPLPADLPAEFKQVLPRGQIASVDAPEFVSAGEADISDEAWILGVVVDGEAHAYSLNLLNHHEIVNDRIGDQSFAAVW